MVLAASAFSIVLGATLDWAWHAWRVKMRQARWGYFLAWGLGIVLGIYALFQANGGAAFAWIAVVLGSMLVLFAALSAQRLSQNSIKEGDTIPQFTGLDANGEPFESSDLEGKRLLIKFFRGHW
ncbi:MAG: hypothetical protein AAF384_04620 [Pseudomonadota bacterium]